MCDVLVTCLVFTWRTRQSMSSLGRNSSSRRSLPDRSTWIWTTRGESCAVSLTSAWSRRMENISSWKIQTRFQLLISIVC